MPLTRPPLQIVALLLALGLAVAASGCGSDDSHSGSRDSAAQEPTATATTPSSPPGAAARSCGRTTVAGTEGLRVTGVGCDIGRGIVATWTGKSSCNPGNEASRVSCAVQDGFRCLGATVDQGVAVSCSRPGSSIAFVARRG